MHAHPPHPPALRRKALPRAAVSLVIGQQVEINGVIYTVAATLVPVSAGPTPTPTPTPVPVPTPVPNPTPTPTPTPVPTPTPNGWIDGYRDVHRDPITSTIEGSQITLTGSGFGAAMGKVMFNSTIPARVNTWKDTEIELIVPHVAAQPQVPRIDVFSPTDVLLAWQWLGLTVLPRPATPPARPAGPIDRR